MHSRGIGGLIVVSQVALIVLSVTARAGSIFDDDWKAPPQREAHRQDLPPIKPDAPVSTVAPKTPADVTRPPATATVNAPAQGSNPTQAVSAPRVIPAAAERARSRTLLKEFFADKLKDTSPRARRGLAQALLDQVSQSAANPSDQYVLITAAIDAAEQGQSLDLAFRASDMLGSMFNIDALAAKNAVVNSMLTSLKPWSDDESNVELANKLAEQLMQDNDFVNAKRVLGAIQRSATRSNNRALAARAQASLRDVGAAQNAWGLLGAKIARLKASSQDPSANFAVGAYLCFIQGQWERGLPYLSRGDNAAVGSAASAEIAFSSDTPAPVVLADADAWWEFASHQPAAQKNHILAHASALYQRAEPGLAGLQQGVAQKRIALIADQISRVPGGKSYSIPSSDAWTTTDVTVEAGKCYEIVGRGAWRGSSGASCGPEGLCPQPKFAILGPQPALNREEREVFYVGQHPRSALIARVASEKWTFYAGADCRFIAPVSGKLSFKINDLDLASSAREGKVEVAVSEVVPRFIARDGTVEILARIDDRDTLHLTPQGIFWTWGGSWTRVGEHDGYYPTVISGIYWWPKWTQKMQTDVFPLTDLWPNNPSQFRIVKVDAKRGAVKLLNQSPADISIQFEDHGGGSSQVGCTVAAR